MQSAGVGRDAATVGAHARAVSRLPEREARAAHQLPVRGECIARGMQKSCVLIIALRCCV